MGKSVEAAALAAVLGGTGLLATGFVAPSAGAAKAPRPAASAGLRGIAAASGATASTGSAIAVGLGAGIAAAALATTRRRTNITKAAGSDFAGGLTGSEYAGWGTYKFDPLQLSEGYPELVPWFREAELKHGRAAMLAFVGLIAPDAFRLPFDECASPDLDFVNAHGKLITGLGSGPMWWLLVVVGSIESLRFKQMGLGFEKLTLETAGDWGLKGLFPSSLEGQAQMRTKELKNGRLAMLAVSGIFTQGVLWNAHHFPFVPQAASSDFAGGLAGSEYAGWGTYKFDPLQLSEGYPELVPWFREAELKHGRAAMLAFVGLIAPDVFRLPFEECASPDLDFVNAHGKLITGLGSGPMWWLLVVVGSIESLRFKQMGLGFEKLTLETAGDWGLKGLFPSSLEGQAQMRTKELKNGRLAMLAVSGIFTQGVLWNVHHFPFVPQAASSDFAA